MTPEEQGTEIALAAAQSAGVSFAAGDPELDRAWADSTSAADFEKRAFDLAWARALQPLKDEMKKKQTTRRTPTPAEVINAVAPNWSPAALGGFSSTNRTPGAPAERARANAQAGQGAPAKAREARKHLEKAWEALR